MWKAQDLTGNRYGKLVVIERAKNTKDGKAAWICKCDCTGKMVAVRAANLKSGSTRSCGCLMKESRKIVSEKLSGNKSPRYKHGLSRSRINMIYREMKRRCFSEKLPAFEHYGKRGIVVCDEWLGENGFGNFYKWSMENGYNENLTLDRIDVNGNYEPNNCRWTTMEKQQNNRTNNVRISYNGEEHTLSEWAGIIGITKCAIYHRYERGWDIEKMLKK